MQEVQLCGFPKANRRFHRSSTAGRSRKERPRRPHPTLPDVPSGDQHGRRLRARRSDLGRRAGEAVIEHMKSDPLVLWAWNPGAGRTTPPLSHEKLVEALEAWVSAGMPCPNGG